MVFDKLGFCTKPPKLVAQDPRRILKDPHNYSEGSSRIRRRILKDLAAVAWPAASPRRAAGPVAAASAAVARRSGARLGGRASRVRSPVAAPGPCAGSTGAAQPASRKVSNKLHPKPITTIGQRLASHLPIPGYNPGPQSSHVASRL